jgi:hypothetical protein
MKDNSLKGMSLSQLTELLNFTNSYADFLQRTNQTNMGQPVNFSDLKISDQNREAILSEAEVSAKAYAESRNRNAQPKNLTGLDQTLVASVKAWANNRKSHLRGKK